MDDTVGLMYESGQDVGPTVIINDLLLCVELNNTLRGFYLYGSF